MRTARFSAGRAGIRQFLDIGSGLPTDLRDPRGILDHPVTREVLDFNEPIALMLVAILHFIADEDRA